MIPLAQAAASGLRPWEKLPLGRWPAAGALTCEVPGGQVTWIKIAGRRSTAPGKRWSGKDSVGSGRWISIKSNDSSDSWDAFLRGCLFPSQKPSVKKENSLRQDQSVGKVFLSFNPFFGKGNSGLNEANARSPQLEAGFLSCDLVRLAFDVFLLFCPSSYRLFPIKWSKFLKIVLEVKDHLKDDWMN